MYIPDTLPYLFVSRPSLLLRPLSIIYLYFNIISLFQKKYIKESYLFFFSSPLIC